MNKIKKLFFSVVLTVGIFSLLGGLAQQVSAADDSNSGMGFGNTDWVNSNPGGGSNSNGTGGAIIGVAGASDADVDTDLIAAIKTGINWALGMLSLIALIILLWGGFQMVTAAGDDGKHKKGWTILKQAAVGLFFIGLAWFIVSIIFWLIRNVTT